MAGIKRGSEDGFQLGSTIRVALLAGIQLGCTRNFDRYPWPFIYVSLIESPLEQRLEHREVLVLCLLGQDQPVFVGSDRFRSLEVLTFGGLHVIRWEHRQCVSK